MKSTIMCAGYLDLHRQNKLLLKTLVLVLEYSNASRRIVSGGKPIQPGQEQDLLIDKPALQVVDNDVNKQKIMETNNRHVSQ